MTTDFYPIFKIHISTTRPLTMFLEKAPSRNKKLPSRLNYLRRQKVEEALEILLQLSFLETIYFSKRIK